MRRMDASSRVGGNYPGAHGLTLVEQHGAEFLWLTDQETAVVVKTTIDGDIECEIVAPPYAAHEPTFQPGWQSTRRGTEAMMMCGLQTAMEAAALVDMTQWATI